MPEPTEGYLDDEFARFRQDRLKGKTPPKRRLTPSRPLPRPAESEEGFVDEDFAKFRESRLKGEKTPPAQARRRTPSTPMRRTPSKPIRKPEATPEGSVDEEFERFRTQRLSKAELEDQKEQSGEAFFGTRPAEQRQIRNQAKDKRGRLGKSGWHTASDEGKA